MEYKGVKKICKTCEFRFRNGRSYICANAHYSEKISDIEEKFGKGEKECWHIGIDAFLSYIDSLPEEERAKFLYC